MTDETHAPVRTPRAIHAIILLVTSGLTTLVTAVLGPSLPKMQAHFAAVPNADYWVPQTMTIPMLAMAIVSVFIGSLADAVGRKRILVLSTALYAIVGTAPLWLESLHNIVISRVLVGLCEAALMTVSTTMIGDYYAGSRRQKFMALQTTVASSSAFMLNLLGGVIGEYGWRAPYAVFTISIPLAILMAIFLWEPKPLGKEDAGVHVDDAPGVTFRPRQLVGICAVAFLVGLVFLIVVVHLGYLFGSLGVQSSSAIGLAYGLNSLGVIAGTLVFGWIVVKRFSVPGQLALAATLVAAGFLGMSIAHSYAALTAAAVLNGFGSGLLLPTAVTWNMRELPFAHRGLGVGAFQSALFFGMFLNPFMVVGLDHLTGGRANAIGVVGLATLVAAVAAIIWSMRVPRPILTT